jgi:hypothetical protein
VGAPGECLRDPRLREGRLRRVGPPAGTVPSRREMARHAPDEPARRGIGRELSPVCFESFA